MIVIQDILAKKPIDIIPYWCKTLLTINSRKSILTQNKYFVPIVYHTITLIGTNIIKFIAIYYNFLR